MSLTHPASAWQLEDGSVVVAPELTTELPGGLTGHFQRTIDDCMRASVATLLQWDYDDVDIREQAEESMHRPLVEFAKRHRITLSGVAAEEPPDGLWIAISPAFNAEPNPEPPMHHVFVARGAEVFFCPWNFRRPDGTPYPEDEPQAARTAAYGYQLTLERTQTWASQ
jgi:hypothetical protein